MKGRGRSDVMTSAYATPIASHDSAPQLTPQYKIQSALRRRHDALPGTSLQGFISALYFEPGRLCSPFTGPLRVQKGPFAEVCVKVDRRPDQKSEHERRRRRVRPVSPSWVPVVRPAVIRPHTGNGNRETRP
ncbi:unnamed protein product [Boreogadus saida]